MGDLLGQFSIDAGSFVGSGGVFLSLSADEVAKTGLDQSRLFSYFVANGAMREIGTFPWKVVSMAVVRWPSGVRGLALSEDGKLLSLGVDNHLDLSIDARAGNPPLRGPLRKVRSIGSDVVVVGMNHQVYKVSEGGQWEDLSPPAAASPIGGFEALAGTSAADMVCAGWRGTLWRRSGTVWRQLVSPTNVLISDLARMPSGSYVGCGLAGLVVAGVEDTWRVFDQGRFDLNLYSVAAGPETTLVASLYGVYRFSEERLYPVDFGADPPLTAHTVNVLTAGFGLLGAKDLFLQDGGQWRRIE